MGVKAAVEVVPGQGGQLDHGQTVLIAVSSGPRGLAGSRTNRAK